MTIDPLTYVVIRPAIGWRVTPLFAWYDLWIGAYWDRKSRSLYVLPLPCVGLVIHWPQPEVRILDERSLDRILSLGFGEDEEVSPSPFTPKQE